MAQRSTKEARYRRHARLRVRLEGTAARPRLCVFRSLKHIQAQIIDDAKGDTIASASTLDQEVRDEAAGKAKTSQAGLVGSLIAKRARDKGIKQVIFDRGGYQYHGRVKALAEAARQGGLKF